MHLVCRVFARGQPCFRFVSLQSSHQELHDTRAQHERDAASVAAARAAELETAQALFSTQVAAWREHNDAAQRQLDETAAQLVAGAQELEAANAKCQAAEVRNGPDI